MVLQRRLNQHTLDELQYLRETALDTAMFYDQRLKDYLQDFPNMFPIYRNWNSKGMSPNKRTAYFSGLTTDIPRNYGNWIYKDCGTDLRPRLLNMQLA